MEWEEGGGEGEWWRVGEWGREEGEGEWVGAVVEEMPREVDNGGGEGESVEWKKERWEMVELLP